MINVSWYVGLILVVERTRGEERLRWEWKLMFKKIAPDLAKFVGLRIRNLLKTTLDSELGDWTRLGVLHTESVPQELWGGKLDYPKSISKVNFGFACQGIFEWKQQLFNFPCCTCCCLNILYVLVSVSVLFYDWAGFLAVVCPGWDRGLHLELCEAGLCGRHQPLSTELSHSSHQGSLSNL